MPVSMMMVVVMSVVIVMIAMICFGVVRAVVSVLCGGIAQMVLIRLDKESITHGLGEMGDIFMIQLGILVNVGL